MARSNCVQGVTAKGMQGFRVWQLAVKVYRDLQHRCSSLETQEILSKSSTELAPHFLGFTIGCVLAAFQNGRCPLGILK